MNIKMSTPLFANLILASLSTFLPLNTATANSVGDEYHTSESFLEEVVVTGTRTEKTLLFSPYSASVISAEEMKWFATASVAELMRDVPGLNVSDAGQAGMKRVRIRGEESYRVAILVDGQEITDHRGEGVPLTIDPAVIERVEVIKGAGSVLYGPKALGGVINFITRKGGDKPFQLSASIGTDTATQSEQYSISMLGSLNTLNYRLSYTKQEQGERDTPEGEVENTASASDSVSLYIAKTWDAHQLAMTWEDHNAHSDVFVEDEVRFAFPFNEFAMEIPQRDRSKLGVFYQWDIDGEVFRQLQANTYRQENDRKFQTYWSQIFGTEKETFSESRLVTEGSLIQLDLRPLNNHFLTTGLQYTKDRVKQDRLELLHLTVPAQITNTTEIFDQASVETSALFMQDDWQINEHLSILAGVRQYWIDANLEESTREGLITPPKDDNELISTVALSWDLSNSSVLRIGYSEGYMYPSLLQLAIGGVARTFVNPDPTLEPEASKTYDLGWRFSNDKYQLDLTVFQTETENYIDHIPCQEADQCIGGTRRSAAEKYVNIGEATTFGLEGSLDYQISDGITAYAAGAWLRRENHFEHFSTYDSGLPLFSGTTGIRYEGRPIDDWEYWLDFFVRGETRSRELDESASARHNPGWTTVNLSTGIAFKESQRYRLVLDFKNLLNQRYSTSYENLLAPGRSVYARVAINF